MYRNYFFKKNLANSKTLYLCCNINFISMLNIWLQLMWPRTEVIVLVLGNTSSEIVVILVTVS